MILRYWWIAPHKKNGDLHRGETSLRLSLTWLKPLFSTCGMFVCWFYTQLVVIYILYIYIIWLIWLIIVVVWLINLNQITCLHLGLDGDWSTSQVSIPPWSHHPTIMNGTASLRDTLNPCWKGDDHPPKCFYTNYSFWSWHI